MDIQYQLQGITFEWDLEKADENLRNHQIAFETACEAFFDPFVCTLEEETHRDEVRETLLGMALNWKLLYVVFVIRRGDVFRLISARVATPTERHIYEDQ